MKPEEEQLEMDNEERARQEYLDASYDIMKDQQAEQEFEDLTESEREELISGQNKFNLNGGL